MVFKAFCDVLGCRNKFGQYLGSFNVPHALATLAHDGRRSAYFRKELLNALRFCKRGILLIEHERFMGRRHGAESIYALELLSYAVDRMVMENAISGDQTRCFRLNSLLFKKLDGMIS